MNNNYLILENDLKRIFSDQSRSIFDSLIIMHKKNVNPNESFNDLVKDLIPEKYLIYEFKIIDKIIRLLPPDLLISIDNNHIFMTKRQFSNCIRIQKENELNNTEKIKINS